LNQYVKKNILILPRWYPNKEDIQLGNFIRQQAILLKDDFAISVIYVQADSSLKHEFEILENKSDGIHEIIVYFKQGNGVFGKLINARRYKKAQQLGFEKIKNQIDLCHVHVPYRPAFLALKLKRQKNIPFVITEHWSGHLTGEYQKKNATDKSLYKSVLKKASAISCVSQLLAKKFRENTSFEAVVIPNYIEYFPISSDSKSNDRIQLLSVADMHDAVKNISGLIHALSAALKTNSNLHLTLIGGGPDEEKILNLMADLNLSSHISFKGRLPHNAVLSEMNFCDFYICNSNFETFGMTVAEALRCGKPVISTRCGGPEEFLNEGNSILINPNNNNGLSVAILKMATEYQNYDSDKLSNEMELKFGKESVKNMWVEFYNKGSR
jgi:glycosyltransferase involved in cell wall biosynthesis